MYVAGQPAGQPRRVARFCSPPSYGWPASQPCRPTLFPPGRATGQPAKHARLSALAGWQPGQPGNQATGNARLVGRLLAGHRAAATGSASRLAGCPFHFLGPPVGEPANLATGTNFWISKYIYICVYIRIHILTYIGADIDTDVNIWLDYKIYPKP